MNEQPEALRLADALEMRGFLGTTAHEAAIELRRLYELNEHNYAMTVKWAKAFGEQSERIKELLEALKLAKIIIGHPDDEASKHIAATIAKAEGKSK